MAPTNRERVHKAFEYLSEGLYDFVDGAMTDAFGNSHWNIAMAQKDAEHHNSTRVRDLSKRDVYIMLRAITENRKVFTPLISPAAMTYAQELREERNTLAHDQSANAFPSEKTLRILDTAKLLLEAADAPDSAADVRKLHSDLQQQIMAEQTRARSRQVRVSVDPEKGILPWREVLKPHDDVARGDFTASEFAADLHLVSKGEATSPEYGDPVEFFARTYLTSGLKNLLSTALKRISGNANASPVMNLQTNFGGGKTHSMLALYHLFSGTPSDRFPDELQSLIAASGVNDLANLGVKRVALVGTYLKPGSPSIKADGTEVNTIWGELAWQLGGREAYEIIAADDQAGTNPGEDLRTLIAKYSPALILIDEWVAYARGLISSRDLPGGNFENQFSFAQSLTEVVRSIPGAMLVLSIPASDGAADGDAYDIEVGGENGALALSRLQNVIRRVADQWQPSTKDESFEIVRRRLFETPDAESARNIRHTARQFATMYTDNKRNFPSEVSGVGTEYEARIVECYPLHPELLDRLYDDWSALHRFQRTRGVLSLVSSIVHELWASNDRSPLIMPANVPLAAESVNSQITQYLEDNWRPIIDSDIDGTTSTAHMIDLERTALGNKFVTQRIARTIFMGATPRLRNDHKGLDKQYVWLGSAMPGDTLGNFGTAIEQLGQRSAYFYEQEGGYWFDTHASVSKTARDYSDRLREDPETVWNEIVKRLQSGEKKRGLFSRVHIAPSSPADVVDDETARLVILHPRHTYRKQDGSNAEVLKTAREYVERVGSSNRIHRNTLLFLAADAQALTSLESAVRDYLAWSMVCNSADTLNLSRQQFKQAENNLKKYDQTVKDRLRDAYMWAIYPEQFDPVKNFEMQTARLRSSGLEGLSERASDLLRTSDQLIPQLGEAVLGNTIATQLKSLWTDRNHVSVGELWGYFTQYVYMPRLVSRDVLDSAIRSAMNAALMPHDAFALAEKWDEDAQRYVGLHLLPMSGRDIPVTDSLLLVRAAVAEKQAREDAERQRQEQERAGMGAGGPGSGAGLDPVSGVGAGGGWDALGGADAAGGGYPESAGNGDQGDGATPPGVVTPPATPAKRQFYGSVSFSAENNGRIFSSISQNLISHLMRSGADVTITVEINAENEKGFDESERRIISENAASLRFDPETDFQ